MNDFMSFRPSITYSALIRNSSYDVYEDDYILLDEFLVSVI